MNGLINYENAYDYIDKVKYLHSDKTDLKQISSSIFNKLFAKNEPKDSQKNKCANPKDKEDKKVYSCDSGKILKYLLRLEIDTYKHAIKNHKNICDENGNKKKSLSAKKEKLFKSYKCDNKPDKKEYLKIIKSENDKLLLDRDHLFKFCNGIKEGLENLKKTLEKCPGVDTINIRDVIVSFVEMEIDRIKEVHADKLKESTKDKPNNTEILKLIDELDNHQMHENLKQHRLQQKDISQRALNYIDKITSFFVIKKPDKLDDNREMQLTTVLGSSPEVIADAIRNTEAYNKGKEFLFNNGIVNKGKDILNEISSEIGIAGLINNVVSIIGISALGAASIKTGVVVFAIAAYYGFKYYTGTRKYGEDVVSKEDFFQSLDIFCLDKDSVLQQFVEDLQLSATAEGIDVNLLCFTSVNRKCPAPKATDDKKKEEELFKRKQITKGAFERMGTLFNQISKTIAQDDAEELPNNVNPNSTKVDDPIVEDADILTDKDLDLNNSNIDITELLSKGLLGTNVIFNINDKQDNASVEEMYCIGVDKQGNEIGCAKHICTYHHGYDKDGTPNSFKTCFNPKNPKYTYSHV